MTVTNSYEALVANYRLGHRVFEVDLRLTSDNYLVAVHDWYGYYGPVKLERFKNSKVAGVYTTMSLDDIYQFMEAHKDAYIITDTKSYEDTEDILLLQFNALCDGADGYSPELLDRVIPQIYNQRMYELITGIHPFKSVIYTLYASKDSNAQVAEFVQDKADIKVIAMAASRCSEGFCDSLNDLGKLIYLHTLNDLAEINRFKRQGVHGFYTNFVIPVQLSGKVVATPTSSAILLNSRRASLAAYNIDGSNYFKLRDLANALSGTEKQFEIDWNASNTTISLTSGNPYTAVGGEMAGIGAGSKTPAPISPKICLDGKAITFVAYNIDGNNYFKLRDIGEALDFGVTWDGAKNTIAINTGAGYSAQ